MSEVNVIDEILECFFLGTAAPQGLTIGAFRKSGREVAVRGYARVAFDGVFQVKSGNLFNKEDIVFAPAHDDWGEIDSVVICNGDKKLVIFDFKTGLSVTVGTKLRIPAKQMSIKLATTALQSSTTTVI